MADNTHETKIVISGDAQGATGALSKVSSAIKGVLGGISQVTRFLSRLNWAIGAVTMVVDAFKKFYEWTKRAETAARELREELAKSKYDTQAAHAAAAYEKLTKQLAEVNRLEKERNEILDQREKRSRDLEDANLERDKQLEISRLNPSAPDYAQRKKEIERKYATQASDVAAARAGEDVQNQAARYYGEADSKERQAAAMEKEYDKQQRVVDAATERSWKAAMKARSTGGDDDKAAAKEADEEFKRQFDRAKKMREDIDKVLAEAQSLRNKGAELAGANRAANIKNEANKQRIENEAKAEAAAEQKKQEDEKKKREQNLGDARLARQKEEELAALDPGSADYAKRKREIENKYELEAAKTKIDRATNDEDRAAAEEELKALQLRQGREAAVDVQSRADNYMNRFAGEIDSWRPKNRLTAMGLDSGAAADHTAKDQARNVQKLVELLTQQVDLTRNANHYNTATFAP